MQTIPQRLKKVRTALGCTSWEQLGERMNYDRSYLADVAKGKRDPGDRLVRAIDLLEREIESGLSHDLRTSPQPMPTSELRLSEDPEAARYASPRLEIKRARERKGLSFSQLARITKLPADLLMAVEERGQRPSRRQINVIAKALDLDPDALATGSDDPEILHVAGLEGTHGAMPQIVVPIGMKNPRFIPILAKAEAGPLNAGHLDDYYHYAGIFAPNVDDRAAFALPVSGNSMEPELADGEIVVCSPAAPLNNGEVAVVRTREDQVYIKFWMRSKDRVYLHSANPEYEPIELPLSQIAGAWAVVHRGRTGKIKKQL